MQSSKKCKISGCSEKSYARYASCEMHYKEYKREYDKKRRKEKTEEIKRKKKEYYERVKHTQEFQKKAKMRRKKRQKEHNEYCRTREYKKKKKKYDAEQRHGEYRECYEIMEEIFKIVRASFDSKYERLKARGYYENKNSI